MTKTATNLIGIVLTILAGIFLYMQLCSSCGASVAEEPVKEEAVVPAVPDPTSYPLAFSDGDFACNTDENYNFNVSSSSILTPIGQGIDDCIGTLKAYLAENTDKVVNVAGYYKSDETNNSAFPNLGLARANAVKNNLVENGISSTQINTSGQLREEMEPNENSYMGPVSFAIANESSEAADELKALYEKIKATPLVLYFDKARASISLTSGQRQQLADISRYLDKVEGASCSVVGHTDNTSSAASNMRLGQSRANFAKDYLMKNGIDGAKINASSKGQTEPVESNATEEGRSKNRRTVVTLN